MFQIWSWINKCIEEVKFLDKNQTFFFLKKQNIWRNFDVQNSSNCRVKYSKTVRSDWEWRFENRLRKINISQDLLSPFLAKAFFLRSIFLRIYASFCVRHVCTFVCVCVYACVYACVYEKVCMCLFVYMKKVYVCTCVRICVHVCVCMFCVFRRESRWKRLRLLILRYSAIFRRLYFENKKRRKILFSFTSIVRRTKNFMQFNYLRPWKTNSTSWQLPCKLSCDLKLKS